MSTCRRRRASSLLIGVVVIAGVLGGAVSVSWAGMAQQSPVFRAKGQALYEAPAPPPAGAPAGPGGTLGSSPKAYYPRGPDPLTSNCTPPAGSPRRSRARRPT